MKKLVVISAVILSSCANNTPVNTSEDLFTDSTQTEYTGVSGAATVPADSISTTITDEDSVATKITTLLVKTEKVKDKVKEIKAIKQENAELKKELVDTKAELQVLQQVLNDTSSVESYKKKKTFFQKVISTIKKDTIE